jgi:hypothetical protein
MNYLVSRIAVIRCLWAFCLVLSLLFSSPARAQNPSSSAKSTDSEKAPARAPHPAFHEDWSTLTLEHSTLQLKLLTLLGKEDIKDKGFIRELYEVEWRPGDPFDLYIILPRGVTKPPAILYLYTFPDDTDIYKNDHWCEGVTAGGYAAIGMVSNLTGHRGRLRLGKEWFVSEMQEALATTTHDVQLVLNYLAARGDINMNRIGMFGVGSGGAITILASAADSRLRAVDLLGPWGDWPEWLATTKVVTDGERPNFLKPEFLAKVAPLDPVTWLPRTQAKSIRIQNVRTDLSLPNSAQAKIEAAAPDFAVINEYGNKRSFLTNLPQPMLLDWLKEQLKTDAKQQVAAAETVRIHSFPAIETPPERSPIAPTPAAEKPKDKAEKPKDKEKDKVSDPSGN